MKYNDIIEGVFLERPNRFIAKAAINGEEKICHVKNTGRCRELLTAGARIFLEHSADKTRKTEYDLVAVEKNGVLFNIDSQAPNKVFGEWISTGGFFENVTLVRPERFFRNSRFDFYIEADGRAIFVEVKGVTLEQDGVLLFPDAPTERGAKHLCELVEAKKQGYDAYIFFIIQTDKCKYFTPNAQTDPKFTNALKYAVGSGVEVRALLCNVTKNELSVKGFTEVKI